MARLNEAPGPVESVDALKRRFVRQNRELARINSNQSVRIRNLESEISRLLSENLTYRERVIKLQHEADRGPRQAAMNSVAGIHSSMEAKLAELGTLVQDLGKAHGSLGIPQVSRRKSTQQRSPKKSPDQKNWKNTLSLSEVRGCSDISRLPPIVEDKYFPRRTLERDELLDILDFANVSDSPELGPPPVATFDEGDPIKYDNSAPPAEAQTELPDCENMRLPFAANLETRRKRRESSHHPEVGQLSSSSESRPPQTVGGHIPVRGVQPLKAGAKRKFNVRDDDEGNDVVSVMAQETLKPVRKVESPTMSEPERNIVDSGAKRLTTHDNLQRQTPDYRTVPSHQGSSKDSVASSGIKGRKALVPKSVNTDPVHSPAKVRKSIVGDKPADGKDHTSKKPKEQEQPKAKSFSRKNDRATKKAVSNEVASPLAQVTATRPETPASFPVDTLSPHSSERSSSRPKSQDTPPPPDLDSGTTTFGTLGRGTRRPRSSVSYTEPNLRHKMRRPTKELVDAVGADDRLQLIKVEELKPASADAEKAKIRALKVKREDTDEGTSSAWKKLPLSINEGRQYATHDVEAAGPLDIRSQSVIQLPDTVAFVKGPHSSDASADLESRASSASGSTSTRTRTIATLVAASQRARRHENDSLDERAREAKDLFELHTSSPTDVVANENSTAPARASRRHSSVANNFDSNVLDATKKGSIARRGDRRRGSTLSATAEVEEQGSTETELNSIKAGGLQPSASDKSLGRAERSANRRRSMML